MTVEQLHSKIRFDRAFTSAAVAYVFLMAETFGEQRVGWFIGWLALGVAASVVAIREARRQ